MITNAAPWENLKFDVEVLKRLVEVLWNAIYYILSLRFMLMLTSSVMHPQIDLEKRPEIDRWIISLLNSLLKRLMKVITTRSQRPGAIADFVNDNLSNWYVRLNRKRFWGGEMSDDKLSAYQTLYYCLVTITKLMAPIAPFYADRLYLDLTSVTEGINKLDSVHLDDFPQADELVINKPLEEQMYLAQSASSIILSLRRKVNIKVRQPLSKIMIPIADGKQKVNIEAVEQLILNEVNVKELLFVDSANEMLVKKVKPDFKKLGPRYGKIMKQLAVKIQEMENSDINKLESNGSFILT